MTLRADLIEAMARAVYERTNHPTSWDQLPEDWQAKYAIPAEAALDAVLAYLSTNRDAWVDASIAPDWTAYPIAGYLIAVLRDDQTT